MAGGGSRPLRPPTRSGRTVVFLTLEDEYGLVDVTVLEDVYRKNGRVLYSAPLLLVTGTISRRDEAELASIIAPGITALR